MSSSYRTLQYIPVTCSILLKYFEFRLIAAGIGGVYEVHGSIGLVTMIVAVLAAAAAVWWKRISGNTGLMMHALTVGVLAIVQYGLGEGGVRNAHIVIGVLLVIAAVALGTLSLRPAGMSARRRRA